MGTRYQEGDQIIREEDGKSYEVLEVKEPESDSPTYIVGRSGIKKFVKASDIKKEKHDIARSTIVSELRDKIQKWSDIEFIRTYTSPTFFRQYEREAEGDVIAVAKVKDGLKTRIGVNGDYKKEYSTMEKAVEDTMEKEGYEEKSEMDKGGKIRSYEAEYPTAPVIDETTEKLGANKERVIDIFEEEYDPYESYDGVDYWTSSGTTAYYEVK